MKQKSSDPATKHDVNLLKEDINTLKDEMTTFKDDIMTKLDYIVGELETIREDRLLAVHQTKELEEKVEDHEKRLTDLEQSS